MDFDKMKREMEYYERKLRDSNSVRGESSNTEWILVNGVLTPVKKSTCDIEEINIDDTPIRKNPTLDSWRNLINKEDVPSVDKPAEDAPLNEDLDNLWGDQFTDDWYYHSDSEDPSQPKAIDDDLN